jgi:hypothetical protein
METKSNGNGKSIIFNIAIAISGALLLLLVNDMRQGINRLDMKMDVMGAKVEDNRTRISVLEENRKQTEAIMHELQKLNRAFVQ